METLIDQIQLYFTRVADYPLQIVAIELILIGLVVYWIVDFLEGTRGERLFRAVIFILIVGFLVMKLLVGQFQFERLQYLYNGFLIGVLIIAVAAFQPEVRRALMRIGQSHFWSTASQQLSRTVEELVAAVKALSEARIGAIIVDRSGSLPAETYPEIGAGFGYDYRSTGNRRCLVQCQVRPDPNQDRQKYNDCYLAVLNLS